MNIVRYQLKCGCVMREGLFTIPYLEQPCEEHKKCLICGCHDNFWKCDCECHKEKLEK